MKNASGTRSLEAFCETVTECYCTKNTNCGWCEASNTAMVGNSIGPRIGHCAKWILKATHCPILYCSTNNSLPVEEFLWFPLATMCIWVLVWFWRHILRRKYMKSVSNARGMQTALLATDTFNTDVELSVCDNQCCEMSSEFLQPIRSFEAFRKGLNCPAVERLPVSTNTPYHINIDSVKPIEVGRPRIFRRFSKTLLVSLKWRVAAGASLRTSATLTVVSACYLSLLRMAAQRLDAGSYAELALATHEMGSVVQSLSTAVALLLSFYALNRVTWYWNVQTEGFKVQGRAHDIAMLAGTKPKETEEDWREIYRLYRYVMLAFYFPFSNLVPRLRTATLQHLVNCGLLEIEEAALLEQCHRSPGTILENWIADWIERNLQAEVRQQTYYALREYRSCLATVPDLLDQRAPVSFESLLYVVVYLLCIVMPFGPTNIDYHDRGAVMSSAHIAPVLGVTIQSCFYLSLLHMLRAFTQPFDDDKMPLDALRPEQIMLSTERKLRDYLTAARPSKAGSS